jgi:hypothetical protein
MTLLFEEQEYYNKYMPEMSIAQLNFITSNYPQTNFSYRDFTGEAAEKQMQIATVYCGPYIMSIALTNLVCYHYVS